MTTTVEEVNDDTPVSAASPPPAAAASSTTAAEMAESAKNELTVCEKEISLIRATLRSLTAMSQGGELTDASSDAEGAGSAGGADHDYNTVSLAWVKMEGVPATMTSPEVRLQLSSPVEEIVLTKQYDPLDAPEGDHNVYATAVFRGVETAQATLVVSAYAKETTTNGESSSSSTDPPVALGTSEVFDVSVLTQFDPLKTKQHYESELSVPIYASDSTSAAANEEKEEEKDVDDPAAEPSNGGAEEDSSPKQNLKKTAVVCTVSFKITYSPSNKDRREELYELLNKATQSKAIAVEKLRNAAMAAAKAQPTTATATPSSSSPTKVATTTVSSSPTTRSSNNVHVDVTPAGQAVKAGFLNKKKELPVPPTLLERTKLFYELHLGPNSLLRALIGMGKNYFLFLAFCSAMHFKGQLLALPPPV